MKKPPPRNLSLYIAFRRIGDDQWTFLEQMAPLKGRDHNAGLFGGD